MYCETDGCGERALFLVMLPPPAMVILTGTHALRLCYYHYEDFKQRLFNARSLDRLTAADAPG